MAIFRLISGLKIYLAATGLLGVAIHHFANGMMGQGNQALLMAFVAAGLRRAIARLQAEPRGGRSCAPSSETT